MDEFLQNLRDALNQPDLEIQPDDKLQDLPNWDSLSILMTISMLDMEYGLTVSSRDLQACPSVGDLYDLARLAHPDAR